MKASGVWGLRSNRVDGRFIRVGRRLDRNKGGVSNPNNSGNLTRASKPATLKTHSNDHLKESYTMRKHLMSSLCPLRNNSKKSEIIEIEFKNNETFRVNKGRLLRSCRKLEGLWVGHVKLFGWRQLELHLKDQRH